MSSSVERTRQLLQKVQHVHHEVRSHCRASSSIENGAASSSRWDTQIAPLSTHSSIAGAGAGHR